MNATIYECKEVLEGVIRQLDRWARESRAGGWSTHQVEPQRKLADDLRRFIDTAEYPESLRK